jgi:hypothetical protein
MSSANSIARFMIGIGIGFAVCIGLQSLAYFGFNWKTGKGESNYFSTLGRFQVAAHPAARVALAGSSISGRIPGREAGFHDIANLGADGGAAIDAITLITRGKIETPEWLIIEANTMHGGVTEGESTLVKAAQGAWFSVGGKLPLLGHTARPSAMLYAALLRRPVALTGEDFPVTPDRVGIPQNKNAFRFTDGEKKRLRQYERELGVLQGKGCKLIIATFPAGDMTEREDWLMRKSIAELVHRYPMTYLDLKQQIPRDRLLFTDSVHLAPKSATDVLATIKAAIRRIESK